MKTNLTIGLSALCAILLIVLLVLQTKQKSELEMLRQEHQTFTTTTEQRQQESHDAVAKLAEHVATLGTNLESSISLADQQQKEQRAERETSFREMRKQLEELVSSGALFPDKTQPAMEAVALAKAAEQAGDMNLAKIYYLSAVNHAPSEFSHLKNYADIVFRDPAAATEDFARLKSVLQISLYQIPPANVTNALALLSETEQRENQLIAGQTPKLAMVNWREQYDQIAKALPLDDTWSDLKRLAKRWESLNQIAESLREEPSQSNLLEQVESDAELTQSVLSASRLTQVMDTILQSLDTSVKQQPEKAVSQLQTAEATLGQLWGIDFNVAGWPKLLSDKVDDYPKAIQSYVEKVAEVKSRPAIAKLEKALADAKNYQIGNAKNKYQQALVYYDGCVSNAIDAAQNISSVAGRKEADDAVKGIRDMALDAKRRQFDAYQKWAVIVCSQALNTFNGYNGNKGWFTEKWMNAFDGTDLAIVDQNLLAPETARLFNDIVQDFLKKMNGDGQFYKTRDLAEKAKRKLEDF
jgi:hypothetical protein